MADQERPPRWWVRVALGLVVLAVMVAASRLSADTAPRLPGWWGQLPLVGVAIWSALAWRFPRLSVVAAPIATIVCFAATTPAFPLPYAMAVPLYVAGRSGRLWWGVGSIAGVVCLSAGYRIGFDHPSVPGAVLLDVLRDSALLVAVLLLGDVIRSRHRIRSQARLAREIREAQYASRLTEQRLGIARDLHDALAHTVTVVNIQSSVVVENLERNPDLARRAAEQIRVATRDATADLRGAIGMLRKPEADGEPEPRIAEVGDLIANASAAGVRVDYRQSGDLDAIRPTVAQAVYRVVQESLTNAIKHGHAASVEISVDSGTEETRVQVRDHGDGVDPDRRGEGFGLRGMRERVTALGGRLEHGPPPDGRGGYLVDATLPGGEAG